MDIYEYLARQRKRTDLAEKICRNIDEVRKQLDKPITHCRSDSYGKSDPLCKLLKGAVAYLVKNVGRDSDIYYNTEFNIRELRMMLYCRRMPEEMYNYINKLTVLQFIDESAEIHQQILDWKYPSSELQERRPVHMMQ